jgi:hypothetical protein
MEHIAPITTRRAHPEEPGVLRVAALDSASVPRSPLLVAEVDGKVRAVLSLDDGAHVADPFHPTRDLLDLLRARAGAGRESRRALLPIRKLRSAY